MTSSLFGTGSLAVISEYFFRSPQILFHPNILESLSSNMLFGSRDRYI
jgi:hypothetical protein